MKLGTVVKVCINFLNHLHFISLKNIAKNTGKIAVANVNPLIAKVLAITWATSFICVALEKSILNHCKPTNSVCDNFNGGL